MSSGTAGIFYLLSWIAWGAAFSWLLMYAAFWKVLAFRGQQFEDFRCFEAKKISTLQLGCIAMACVVLLEITSVLNIYNRVLKQRVRTVFIAAKGTWAALVALCFNLLAKMSECFPSFSCWITAAMKNVLRHWCPAALRMGLYETPWWKAVFYLPSSTTAV